MIAQRDVSLANALMKVYPNIGLELAKFLPSDLKTRILLTIFSSCLFIVFIYAGTIS